MQRVESIIYPFRRLWKSLAPDSGLHTDRNISNGYIQIQCASAELFLVLENFPDSLNKKATLSQNM